MNTSALAFRPALVAIPAGTQTWNNGVVHTDGQTDVYELPSSTPGVAARVELKPVLWGLLGKEVIATDARGTRLEGHRQWEGFHRVVVTRDPQTGLETVLDPREKTVSVSTPRVSEQIETTNGPMAYREKYQQEARQELDEQGNCRYVGNLRGEMETMVVPAPVGSAMGGMLVTTQDDRSWDETSIKKGQAPEARAMRATKEGEVQGGALNASIGTDGKLAVVGEDGVSRNYEMFLRV